MKIDQDTQIAANCKIIKFALEQIAWLIKDEEFLESFLEVESSFEYLEECFETDRKTRDNV